MRVIGAAAKKKLDQQFGSEPIFVIGVNWSGKLTYYADKSIYDSNGNPIILGKIIAINNVESIMNIDGNNTSISVDVTLSDDDGEFLYLFNNSDIHRKPAFLYQYFEDLPLGEMFLLYQGYVVSGIVWNDKDRSFKISIVTMFENYEAGFSPEEGDVANLREDLVGRAWPLGFGTPYKAPTARITDIPIGVTTEPMGFHDPWLDFQIVRLTDTIDYNGFALFYFLAALQAYLSEDFELGDSLTEQGNALLLEKATHDEKLFSIQAMLAAQLAYEKNSTYVLTDYPIHLKGVFQVGNVYLVGTMKIVKNQEGVGFFQFTGPYHNLTFAGFQPTKAEIEANGVGPTQIGIVSPKRGTITDLQGAIARQIDEFIYIEAGSQIRFLGDYPVRYVVNIIPCEIIEVYANRTFEGVERRMKVPKSYYKKITVKAQASRQLPFKTFNCVGIQFFRPLSTLLNQHWTDDVFVTYRSSIGPDFQSIIRYIVQTFSVYDVDEASLATIPSFRMNFVLMELKDTLTLIQEICYQCKVAAVFKEGKFYFYYLPAKTPSQATITVNDVIEDSLEFSFIPTENLITKIIGTWRFDLSDPKENRVVIRYNTSKYGTLEETKDFYAFNVQKAVEATMSFWLFRRGNSWKRLKIQVPLKYLTLENFDQITLHSDLTRLYGINNGDPTPAIILNTIYDPTANILTLELELPIQLGTNNVNPNYWPSGGFSWLGGSEVSQIFNNIVPPNFWNGIDYTPLAQLRPLYIDVIQPPESGGVIGVQFDSSHQSLDLFPGAFWAMDTQHPPGEAGQNSPTRVTGDYGGTLGDYIAPQMKLNSNLRSQFIQAGGIPPAFPMLYGDPAAASSGGGSSAGGGNIPGVITSGSGTTYQVELHRKGVAGKSDEVVSATCLQIDKADTIPKGTTVSVMQINVVLKQSDPPTAQYFFVTPVWL